MNLHLSFKTEKLKNAWHIVFYTWVKHYKIFFFILFLAVVGISTYQWLQDLKRYDWSDEQKQAFIKKTVQETAFQEEHFKHSLDELQGLKAAHSETVDPLRDLFQGKKSQN